MATVKSQSELGEQAWERLVQIAWRCGIPRDEVELQPAQNVLAMIEKHFVGMEAAAKAQGERIAEQANCLDAMARLCNVKARDAARAKRGDGIAASGIAESASNVAPDLNLG